MPMRKMVYLTTKRTSNNILILEKKTKKKKSLIFCKASEMQPRNPPLFRSLTKSIKSSDGARKFIESGQKICRKLTCDIIYKQS